MKTIATMAMCALLLTGLTGCKTFEWLGLQDEKPVTFLTEDGALKMFSAIKNSPQAPCEMQREVAKHNSVYDSFKERKLMEYKAPCDDKPKAKAVTKPAPAPKPATS